MCKPKPGPRCSPHLADGVTSAVAAYAAVETGMKHQDAAQMMKDLEREAAYRPAPTPEEVTDFLREQEWRVRHSPTLTEPKRQSLLNRLRQALARIPQVSGAKFAAWKAALGEAWARTRKKVAAVFLAGSLSFGLGACGSTPAQYASPAPDRPVATSTATPAAEPITVEPGNFGGTEAATVLGQNKVNQGYEEVSGFAGSYGFDPRLVSDTSPTAADFEPMTKEMTPAAAESFRQTVQQALAGDATAGKTLMTAAVFGVHGDLGGDTFTLAKTGPMVVNQRITAPQVSVDRSTGIERLQVSVHQHADLRGTLARGGEVRVPVDKDTTYWLTPAPAGSGSSWLIDGWSGTWSISQTPSPDA